MHQPFDEPFDDELPRRDARGFLIDKYGIALDDAVCAECKAPVPAPTLKHFLGKERCSCCRYVWEQEIKPKPAIKIALQRARRAGLPATLTEEQWQETLQHFKHCCGYCGLNPWRCVEHATPLPPGGTTVSNCVPACLMCNALKRGKTPEEMVEDPGTSPGGGESWIPALEWLRSKGRPVLTADQAKRLLSDYRAELDHDKPSEAVVAFRTRTVADMQIALRALTQSGHSVRHAGRKRKTALTSADAKFLRALAKQITVQLFWP
jgi:hypothetical protein